MSAFPSTATGKRRSLKVGLAPRVTEVRNGEGVTPEQ
jgi:hypothetical protein